MKDSIMLLELHNGRIVCGKVVKQEEEEISLTNVATSEYSLVDILRGWSEDHWADLPIDRLVTYNCRYIVYRTTLDKFPKGLRKDETA